MSSLEKDNYLVKESSKGSYKWSETLLKSEGKHWQEKEKGAESLREAEELAQIVT